VLAGTEMAFVVVVAMTCLMSTTRSDSSDAGVVSNEARKAAIAFRMPSGKGPDRDSAQYSSIQASFASTFSTVFVSSSISAGDISVFSVVVAAEKVVTAAVAAGVVVVVVVVVAECVAVHLSRARAFLAAFLQILSMVVRGSSEDWGNGAEFDMR
jgi:hypothetical protein